MLSYTDRLRRARDDENSHHNHISGSIQSLIQNADPQLDPDSQFADPIDFSVFTFGQRSIAEDDRLVQALLCDLYHILSIAASHQMALPSRLTYERVISLHQSLLSHILDQDTPSNGHPIPTPRHISSDATRSNNHYQLIAPLQLSTFILTSYLLFSSRNGEAPQTQSLARLASRLRALLDSRRRDHISSCWLPFPGALAWCHAIGLRFADPQRDRTWFLMQFLRVTHLSVLETWEETSRSIEMVVYGLERVGRGK